MTPLREFAVRIFNQALKDGSLTRLPCAVCGNPKTLGHHFDYTRPLEVVWLCHSHHAIEHEKLNREKRRQQEYLKWQKLRKAAHAADPVAAAVDEGNLDADTTTGGEDVNTAG